MAGILYSDYYMPHTYFDPMEILKCSSREEANDDEFCEAFLYQSGITKISLEQEKDEVQIFSELLEKYFQSGSVKSKDISHIFYIAFPSEYTKGNVCVPYVLQTKFDLKSATVINMYQDCATVLQSLQIANALIDNGDAKNILILSICFGLKMENRFIGTTIAGDGAGIMIVGNENRESEMISFKSIADGRFSHNLYYKIDEKIWTMDIVKKGSELILEVLKDNNIGIDSVSSLIMQNLNNSGYYVYSKFLNVPLKRLYLKNIPNGGHLAAVDTIRNYTDALREEIISQGDYFLLYAAGTIGTGMDYTSNVVVLRKT